MAAARTSLDAVEGGIHAAIQIHIFLRWQAEAFCPSRPLVCSTSLSHKCSVLADQTLHPLPSRPTCAGYDRKITGKTAEERLDLRSTTKADKFCVSGWRGESGTMSVAHKLPAPAVRTLLVKRPKNSSLFSCCCCPSISCRNNGTPRGGVVASSLQQPLCWWGGMVMLHARSVLMTQNELYNTLMAAHGVHGYVENRNNCAGTPSKESQGNKNLCHKLRAQRQGRLAISTVAKRQQALNKMTRSGGLLHCIQKPH